MTVLCFYEGPFEFPSLIGKAISGIPFVELIKKSAASKTMSSRRLILFGQVNGRHVYCVSGAVFKGIVPEVETPRRDRMPHRRFRILVLTSAREQI